MEITELLKDVFDGMKKSLDADAVIGTPIASEFVTVIPVSKMTVGFASGGAELDGKNPAKKKDAPIGGVGGGASVYPLGFLVMDGENVKFIKTEGGDKWNDCLESIMELFSR